MLRKEGVWPGHRFCLDARGRLGPQHLHARGGFAVCSHNLASCVWGPGYATVYFCGARQV